MGDFHPLAGRGPELISVCGTFMALTIITFALRVHVRINIVKWFGSDDWAAAIGCLLFVVHVGLAITGAYNGAGQHANLIQPPSQLPIALKYWWICEPIFVVSNMAVKLSIALMLLRLVVEDSHRMMIYIVTGIIETYSIVFFFCFVFQCTPPSFFWTRFAGATSGKCMNSNITVLIAYIHSAIYVVYDCTMALLPWFVVRKLQLNLRSKIMVAFVLAMGSIAVVATILRIPYISGLRRTDDLLYNTVDLTIWSCCETGLSITASNAATLKPLFKTFLARTSLLSRSSNTRGSYTTSLTSKHRWSRGRDSPTHYVRATDHSPESSKRDTTYSDQHGGAEFLDRDYDKETLKGVNHIRVDVREASD